MGESKISSTHYLTKVFAALGGLVPVNQNIVQTDSSHDTLELLVTVVSKHCTVPWQCQQSSPRLGEAAEAQYIIDSQSLLFSQALHDTYC
jgi:hypothetical protein